MKRFLRSISILVVLLLSTTAAFAGITKGPYLIFEGSNTTMTVLWQDSATESNVIRWGTDTSYSVGQATVAEYGASHQHKYQITGLTPGTKYYYQVDGYGTGSFVTAPDSTATAVKLLSFGDTRSYPASQETVVARMRSAYAADPAFQSIALHSGDWVSSDGETNWTSEWFASSATYPNMHAFQAEVPINGVRGNHEASGTYFSKYYPFPYAANFYWAFDYGPAHVIVLDDYTTFTAGSTQYNWLVNELSSTTKPWKIVTMHEPAWGAGTHANNTTAQSVLQPLFEQYGVDLVLTGHNHNYCRAVVSGVNHVTNGGGGADLYAVNSGAANIVKADMSYQYSEIAINGNTLTSTARRADGTVIETFTVTHGSTAPAAPTGLTATAGNAQVSLSWAASSGATSYNVKRSTTNGGPYTTVASGVTTTSVIDASLTNGTTYYYVVTAVNAIGESGNSNQASATPAASDTTPPTAPTLTSVAPPTSGTTKQRLVLNWTASTDNVAVTGYDIYRATGSCTNAFSLIATTTASPYTNTGLKSRTTYCYYLKAKDAAGNQSAPSNQMSGTAK
jgi:fibronectin type 3 domain-containing protein